MAVTQDLERPAAVRHCSYRVHLDDRPGMSLQAPPRAAEDLEVLSGIPLLSWFNPVITDGVPRISTDQGLRDGYRYQIRESPDALVTGEN